MHKGRNYPQVIPHEISPDQYPRYFAPVEFTQGGTFEYSSNIIHFPLPGSTPAAVTLQPPSIIWTFDFVLGIGHFGLTVEQTWWPGGPGVKYTHTMVDDFGSVIQQVSRWQLGNDHWDHVGFFTFGVFQTASASGFFTGPMTPIGDPRRYH